MPRTAVTGIVIAFVLLQATNAAVVSIMSLFTTSDLGLDVLGPQDRRAPGPPPDGYAGLAPVTRCSGTSIKGESHVQRGHHALESALSLSAFVASKDPDNRAH